MKLCKDGFSDSIIKGWRGLQKKEDFNIYQRFLGPERLNCLEHFFYCFRKEGQSVLGVILRWHKGLF
ncbi:hypothetical protein CW304_30945 [Bacillus sp. UFRGS-B20]|nr:hypothetical protein CW304_30945 [Bacillus sp. UFRGS-B20]